MTDWDATLPSGSKNITVGDDDIRLNETALEERMTVEHYFPDNSGGTRKGRHKFGVGNTAARNAAITAPAAGNLWFESFHLQLHVYTGSKWAPIGHRMGDVKMAANLAIADHDAWLICDGREISKTTYAGLFTWIGTHYDSNGVDPAPAAGNFRIPRLKGRVPAGFDSVDSDFNNAGYPGKYGGEKTHLLVTGEMPAHVHTVPIYQPGFGGTGSAFNEGDDVSGKTSLGTIDTGSIGGGGAHNNLQPYLVLGFFIYSGVLP